jgi:hypothetical protein
VFDRILNACYHIMLCGFSRLAYLISMLVSVQRVNLQCTVPDVSVH